MVQEPVELPHQPRVSFRTAGDLVVHAGTHEDQPAGPEFPLPGGFGVAQTGDPGGELQRRTLVREFVRDEFTARGMVADVAFHGGRSHNPHAHVLLTTRRIGPDGFGKKERAWNDRALMKTWREEWGAYANRELDAAGRPERIDHRTLEAQRDEAIELGNLENAIDLDRDPQIHIGRARWAAARTGKPHPRVERGNEDAERQRDREVLRARLLEQLDRLQQSIAELRRQIMDRARDFGRRRGFDWSR